MHIPTEIQLEIMQAVVGTLPIHNVVNLRLVNSIFDSEIMTRLIHSPRLESDGFGFRQRLRGYYGHLPGEPSLWWFKFPHRC
ncbi:uncharacterized protein N7479_009904 [Penicillium vulpinum]|uniref:F-box domain-containing protein n=1 Tax=Penicillium vulpinum TaxID=29845 RepID=A0A1V6RYT4_9EURO|nr:uncharacterized protein N7479_009904 [Penicillium vulpinum]KAJ5951491.1 hypothetical protein N7479_009904 [Penicillium vulpinum]OQE06630.1 hypothetical protein PENVUL_c017G04017 [Penicillium vulpinum]